MSIISMLRKGRGGKFVNKNRCYFEKSITGLVIRMPHPEIPNASSESDIREQTGPDGVLAELLMAISSTATVMMHDAVGDAIKNEAGNPDVTLWNVWVESGIISNSAAESGADNELIALASQIQERIREISSEELTDYDFGAVTVTLGTHYDNQDR